MLRGNALSLFQGFKIIDPYNDEILKQVRHDGVVVIINNIQKQTTKNQQ
jgi:hypothetical protein